MDGKWVAGWMADCDAARFVDQDAGGNVVNWGMDRRRQFIHMTAGAVDNRLVGVVDHHLYSGAGGRGWVDVTAGIVTGGANVQMSKQDVRPVLHRVAVRAGLSINHAQVSDRVDLHGMVNGTAGGTMVMTGKGGAMAALALSGSSSGRAQAGCGGGRVTGEAAIGGMDLAQADEGRDRGAMAADAIGRGRGGGGIGLDRGGVTMGVAVEVGAVALDATAALAAVDRGVTIAVDPKPAVAVGRVMAGGARGVDGGDDVAGVAANAEGGGGHRGAVVMAVVVEVEGVAAGAGGTPEDGGDLRPMDRVFQGWGCGVAIGAAVVVDHHRIIGRVTDGHAGRGVEGDAESCG